MIKKILQAVAVLLLLTGLGLFSYPLITQWVYNHKTSQLFASFKTGVAARQNDATQTSEMQELYRRLLAENEKLHQEGQKDLSDPFAYEQSSMDLTQYGIQDNIIAYITIPAMDVRMPIYLGASTQNMELGATHLTQTSYPVGGINTNAVIAAHRGYYKADMFRHIEKLQIGDSVEIQNFQELLQYKVVDIAIIHPDEVDQVLIQPGRDMVTLLTCHPYRYNHQRYVVYCERV